MSREHGVDNDRRAYERERHKSQPDFRAREILGRDGSDLRADGRTGVHHERNHDIDIALDRVRKSPVASRDDDLKEIGSDREMRRDTEDVNHRRHAYVAGAATEKSAENPADKRDQDNHPDGDGFNTRDRQLDHWRKMEFLDSSRDMAEGGMISLLSSSSPAASQRLDAFPDHEPGNGCVNSHRDDADDKVDVAGSLKKLNQLSADFRSGDGAGGHDEAQLQIDVPERAMALRRDNRLADDVSQVGPDRKIPGQTDDTQRRASNETSADAEKAAEDADDEPDNDEIERTDVGMRDGKLHRIIPTGHAAAGGESS
jgi:hypothetical protein